MFTAQNYEPMTAEKRPQDENLDGAGWTYETLEHGGEHPDTMPQAIKATDPQGRSCIYVPVSINGNVVDSKGFTFSATPGLIVGWGDEGPEIQQEVE